MAISDYYVDLTVQRVTTTPNSFGGYSETWTDHLDIKGLINQASSQEIISAEQLNIKCTHNMYTDVGTDILFNDRVKDASNKIYSVTSEPKNTCGRDHHLKIMLEYQGVDNLG